MQASVQSGEHEHRETLHAFTKAHVATPACRPPAAAGRGALTALACLRGALTGRCIKASGPPVSAELRCLCQGAGHLLCDVMQCVACVISAVAFRSQLQHCCSELRRFSIGTFALSRTRDEARWKSSYAWDRCDDKSWKWPPLQLKPSSCVLLGKACMHTRVSNTLEIRI